MILPVVDAGRLFIIATLQNVEIVDGIATIFAEVEITLPFLTNFDQAALHNQCMSVYDRPWLHRSSLRVAERPCWCSAHSECLRHER